MNIEHAKRMLAYLSAQEPVDRGGWYWNNRELSIARAKKWRKDHPGASAMNAKRYREKHGATYRAKYTAYMREWRAKQKKLKEGL